MKTKTLIVAAMMGALATAPAMADGGKHYKRDKNDRYGDYGRVEHVEPVYRIVKVPVSHEECGYEEVTRYQHTRHEASRSYTPMILGGILGGVVGNRFGKGGGKDALTIAGTVLGASVGNDVSHNNARAAEPYRTTEHRCNTVTRYEEREEMDGYRVTYRYNGRRYTTMMPYDPGKRVPVTVDVRPAY